jgi:hypothetical protein
MARLYLFAEGTTLQTDAVPARWSRPAEDWRRKPSANVGCDLKFSIDKTRLDDELQRRYADTIERDTQRLMTALGEEFKGYRCEVHGKRLAIQITWGPNIYCGVIAGYRLEGCCSAFEEDVYRIHFPDEEHYGVEEDSTADQPRE